MRRNIYRFPPIHIQLTQEEYENLILQFARSSSGYGGRIRPLCLHLTRSGHAGWRELLAAHNDLAARVEKLEAGQRDHTIAIGLVAKDVQSLAKSVKKEFKKLRSPRRRKSRIGFLAGDT